MKQFFVILILLLALVACSAQQPTGKGMPAVQETRVSETVTDAAIATTHDVQIKNFEFMPKVLTITARDSVTWTNLDDVAHTATGADFDTGKLGKGESKTLTFGTPGTYSYICALHPKMQGEIIVE